MQSPTKNEIITELFKSKEFNDCISKMEPEHLRADLKAEVMLILCEHDEKKIQQIYSSGGLKFYAARIILNQIQSNTSPFFKTYRQPSICWEDAKSYIDADGSPITLRQGSSEPKCVDEDFVERLRGEMHEEYVLSLVQELYWYDREILLLYIKLGSYRAVEKEIKTIKWQSIYDTVNFAIAIIKSKLRSNANPSNVCLIES